MANVAVGYTVAVLTQMLVFAQGGWLVGSRESFDALRDRRSCAAASGCYRCFAIEIRGNAQYRDTVEVEQSRV